MNRKETALYRKAVDMFVDMLDGITHRQTNYRCNDADVASFENFLKEFGTNSIGENFLKKFLEYQFQSWFNTGMEKDYSHTVRFQWMFGTKAIQRWKKFTPDFNTYLVRSHIKKLGIYKTQTSATTKIPELILRVRPAEEALKKEYFNTRRGYAWCIAGTTLYHHRSPLCARCNFKQDCKKLLKQELPKVYIKRGYGEK